MLQFKKATEPLILVAAAIISPLTFPVLHGGGAA
jgi:hypothetical protein